MSTLRPADTESRPPVVPKGILWPFGLLTSLFIWWGIANNMTDTLLAAFKRIMSMTDSETALIQVVCYGLGYGMMAVPAAIFVKKFSYESAVLLGLGFYATGALLFYPAMLTMEYSAFLVAIWIIFAGLTILEAAANPYILAIGPEETATRRLNFAQSFNPIGAILGVVLSQQFILPHLNLASAEERAAMTPEQLHEINISELQAVVGPYIGVGILMLVMLFLIYFTKMPQIQDQSGPSNLRASFGRLLRNRHYMWGVLAQFCYVGAQIGVWSFIIRYVMTELRLESAELPAGETPESYAAQFYIASLLLFFVSRFVCTWVMRFITPASLLTILAILATVLMACSILVGGIFGVYSLVAVSGCMSLMFPTIFGLSARGLGDDMKLAGAGQVMAIAGAAFFTQIQGVISDKTGSIGVSFLVPLVGFAFIAYYGAVLCRKDLPASKAASQ